jgi:hypothetical protein
MKNVFALISLLLLPVLGFAQGNSYTPQLLTGVGAPGTGPLQNCTVYQYYVDTATGNHYDCQPDNSGQHGTWIFSANPSSLNSIIFVDGLTYPCTAAGIQAAMDKGGQGAHIILPPQTCAISVESSALLAYDGSWIQGSGEFVSTIQRANGGSANNPMFQLASGGAHGTMGNVTFTDFTIDVNRANQTGGSDTIKGGVVSKLIVQRMRPINSWNDGIGIDTSLSDSLIADNDFENNAQRVGCVAALCGDITINSPIRVRIEGNRSSNSGYNFAIFSNAAAAGQVSVVGNTVNGCGGYGVALGSGTLGGAGILISDNTFNCPTSAANIIDMAQWNDVLVSNNYIAVGSGTSLGITDLPPAQRVTVIGNRITGNASGPITGGCVELGGSDIIMAGNLCDKSSGVGLLIDVGSASQSHGFTITNNIVKNASTASSGTHCGIELFLASGGTATLSEGLIANNRAYDDQGSPTQAYGVCLAVSGQQTGFTGINVIGNDVRGNKTGGIFNNTSSPTNLQIYNNPGGESVELYPFNSSTSISSATPAANAAASNLGWKYCLYSNIYCVGLEGFTEVHQIGATGNGSWLSLFESGATPNSNASGTVPDTASKASLGSLGFVALTPQAFASLPACGASLEGQRANVNNSTVNTFGSTIVGGGANHVGAYCNGTNWVVD